MKKYNESKRIIKDAEMQGRLVLFVGAGTSIPSGMPSWADAVKMISKHLDEDVTDDSLKTPQYYYNKRGKKEYTELMRTVFMHGKMLPTNEIHDRIFNFKTSHIITTNYDHLLEKAAKEANEFVYVISSDSDIPYRTSEKEIIKMHGDFEHDNFVLKEDDYLNYHENFKLVETYIKSLIAGNVILVLGYSFNDPDVKHIFSWIRDILGDNAQRAYMLITGRDYSKVEEDYYSNIGISVIFAKDICIDDFEGLSNGEIHQKQLINCLDYLLSDNDSDNDLEKLFMELQPYAELRYVSKRYISKALSKVELFIDGTCLCSRDKSKESLMKLLAGESQIEDYLSTFDNDELDKELVNSKLFFVKTVLHKTCISEVEISGQNNFPKRIMIENVNYEDDYELENAIMSFNYEELLAVKNRLQNISAVDNIADRFKLAYLCYQIYGDKNFEASRYMLELMDACYEGKHYLQYLLAGNNVYHIQQNTTESACKHPIDIGRIKDAIPKLDKRIAQIIEDLKDYYIYYSAFHDVVQKKDKAEKEAKTNYSFYTGDPAFSQMEMIVLDCFKYELGNYIISGSSISDDVYRQYARAILSTIQEPELKPIEPSYFSSTTGGNVKVDCIDGFTLFIILKYMPVQELKDMIQVLYHTKIELFKGDGASIVADAREYLNATIDNLNVHDKWAPDVFWKIVILNNKLVLDRDTYYRLIKGLALRLDGYYFQVYGNIINTFMSKLAEACTNEQISCTKDDCLSKEMIMLANRMLDVIAAVQSGPISRHNSIVNLLYSIDKVGCISDELELNKVLDEKYLPLLSELYDYVSSTQKAKITRIIKKWMWDGTKAELNVFTSLVARNRITYTRENEDSIYNLFSKECIKSKSETVIVRQNNGIMDDVLTLYLNDKLFEPERFVQVLSKYGSNQTKWLVNMDEYDYLAFEPSWLLKCNRNLLMALSNKESVKAKILKSVKDNYVENKVDEKVIDIVMRYFV